jgi:hypothetical protein
MKVSIHNNIKSFNKDLQKFKRVDIPNITRIALNDTAKRIQELERMSMKKSFNKPRPQTLKSIYVIFAKKNKLKATITFRDWAQDFINRNIVGGVRPVKNTAVPTPNAKLNQYGNIPGRKSGVIKGKQFKATIKGTYGVFEPKKDGLKIIHRFVTNPQYRPIFPFYRVAVKAANYIAPLKFEKVANYYIKKAGYKSK